MIDQLSLNKRRALLLLLAVAGVVAAVVLIIFSLAGLPVVGLLVGVAAGGAIAYLVRATADDAVASRLSAAPADPDGHARLHNLVEGLCLAHGLAKPHLLIIEDDAPNALVWGVDPQQAHLAVTRGLLESLDRIELEAVLAHELSRIKQGDTVTATTAIGSVGRISAALVDRVLQADEGQAAAADLQAVEMTRYPPGLASALAKVAAVDGSPTVLDRLWLDDRTSLELRIDTLREL